MLPLSKSRMDLPSENVSVIAGIRLRIAKLWCKSLTGCNAPVWVDGEKLWGFLLIFLDVDLVDFVGDAQFFQRDADLDTIRCLSCVEWSVWHLMAGLMDGFTRVELNVWLLACHFHRCFVSDVSDVAKSWMSSKNEARFA